jgi:hypothetical protein
VTFWELARLRDRKKFGNTLKPLERGDASRRPGLVYGCGVTSFDFAADMIDDRSDKPGTLKGRTDLTRYECHSVGASCRS